MRRAGRAAEAVKHGNTLYVLRTLAELADAHWPTGAVKSAPEPAPAQAVAMAVAMAVGRPARHGVPWPKESVEAWSCP